MFEIEYKGGNTVVFSTRNAVMVCDPKTSVVGLKDTVVKEAIELATEARFALDSPGAKLHIEGPGEYGVSEFDIKGVAAQRHLDTEADPKQSTIYRIEVAGIRVALIGNIYEKLSEDQLEQIGVVDVLVLPVGGGGYTLDATGAVTITRQIEPRVVVPVHYAETGVTYEVPQAPVDEFVKELGVAHETVAKYKLKQASALPAGLTVVQVTRG